VLADKIVHIRKKSNNILQMQTISFKKKHIKFELYNKSFNASHVSLVFEKYNFIQTLIYPAFSG